MNMCTIFYVSNKFTDKLFCFLHLDLLPLPNKLPRNHYEARNSIFHLGMHYNNVHACLNGCLLFEDDNTGHNTCPKCGEACWVDGTKTVLAMVICHFTLIPRLKRMWTTLELARMLTGYTKHMSNDGVMRFVVDSLAWKHVDADIAFGNFGSEICNLRFGSSRGQSESFQAQ